MPQIEYLKKINNENTTIMALTDLTNKEIIVLNPVEIDKAVNDIRLLLGGLPWVSHPFHIAQRFRKKTDSGRTFVYPETYCVNPADKAYVYLPLTPNNDYTGMLFFMVGKGVTDFQIAEYNYITYPVSIIFSVNLEKIDSERLKNEHLFTQDLITSARRRLTEGGIGFDFELRVISETRDLLETYREFSLDELEQYNRAPLQCFRLETVVRIQEECE